MTMRTKETAGQLSLLGPLSSRDRCCSAMTPHFGKRLFEKTCEGVERDRVATWEMNNAT
jgi:hypothetical protein